MVARFASSNVSGNFWIQSDEYTIKSQYNLKSESKMPYFSINGSERGLRASDSNSSQSKEKGLLARAVGFEATVEF